MSNTKTNHAIARATSNGHAIGKRFACNCTYAKSWEILASEYRLQDIAYEHASEHCAEPDSDEANAFVSAFSDAVRAVWGAE